MKIVYVIEQLSEVGGMERILVDKMNRLCSQPQIEVALILLWRDKHPVVYHLDEHIRVVRLNVPRVRGGLLFPLVVLRYNRAVKALLPDVTVFSWVAGAVLAAFGHKRGKTIYESHADAHFQRYRWLQRIFQHRVDAVVTLTPEDAGNYPSARKVVSIPNFTLLKPDREADYSKTCCIAMGRLAAEKDFQRMIRLWLRISQNHPEWILRIYGDGKERANIEMLIRACHAEERIILHGNTSDIAEAYLTGSVFLLTSRTEGFALVLIEAATCGLPLVAFDCPYGPRHIVNDNNGFLIPYEDDDSFVAAVQHLMDNAALRKKMGERAKSDMVRFSSQAVMQQWMQLFTDLLSD